MLQSLAVQNLFNEEDADPASLDETIKTETLQDDDASTTDATSIADDNSTI